MSAENDRYSRQERLPEVGESGQRRLGEGSALVLGCGALGSVSASALARAGVGRIRVVDRDVLELSNLQRQILYDEDDLEAGLPKAEAAARRLRRINSGIEIEARVADVTPRNVEEMLEGISVVLDGTDNLETRYLLNDACLKRGTPWIYAGVVRTSGVLMSILPGRGPCLRCVFPSPPPPGSLPTCDTAGVLGTAPMVVGSLQATEAIKLLLGVEPLAGILTIGLWDGSHRRVALPRDPGCPACGEGRHDFLESRETSWVTSLCGRNSIQITPPREARLDLEELARRLGPLGRTTPCGLVLRFEVEGLEMLIFPDGRVVVQGTADEAVARDLHARYIGY